MNAISDLAFYTIPIVIYLNPLATGILPTTDPEEAPFMPKLSKIVLSESHWPTCLATNAKPTCLACELKHIQGEKLLTVHCFAVSLFR